MPSCRDFRIADDAQNAFAAPPLSPSASQSSHAAYNRIEAARLARRFPMVLERLESGETTVTNLSLLRRLTDDNGAEMLAAARHASKREVEQMIARIAPRSDVPVIIRKLPEPRVTHLGEVGAPAVQIREDVAAEITSTVAPFLHGTFLPATVQPLATERYKVQLTVSRETHDKLRRAQDLLRHVVPNGDAAQIFDRALTVLLEQLERTKLAATSAPRTGRGVTDGSRRIPASVLSSRAPRLRMTNRRLRATCLGEAR